MGMELLEVTLELEDKFQIELTTYDLGEIFQQRDVTAGALYELVLRKLHLRDVGRYDLRLNYQLFRDVRRSLSLVSGRSEQEIELKQPLAHLLPRSSRRDTWSELIEICPYRISELDYPASVRFTGLIAALGMVLVEQIQLWKVAAMEWLRIGLGLLGVWMWAETYFKLLAICAPLRTKFPNRLVTVKDLCRWILAANYVQLCRDMQHNLDDRTAQVWDQIRGTLATTLGVQEDSVSFRSHLVRDLGMA